MDKPYKVLPSGFISGTNGITRGDEWISSEKLCDMLNAAYAAGCGEFEQVSIAQFNEWAVAVEPRVEKRLAIEYTFNGNVVGRMVRNGQGHPEQFFIRRM